MTPAHLSERRPKRLRVRCHFPVTRAAKTPCSAIHARPSPRHNFPECHDPTRFGSTLNLVHDEFISGLRRGLTYDRAMPQGVTCVRFSDLIPGFVIRTPPRLITAKEMIEFASRYDPQSFHVDPERASEGRWKGLIASGWHTCAIAMELMVRNVLSGVRSIRFAGSRFVEMASSGASRRHSSASLRSAALEQVAIRSHRNYFVEVGTVEPERPASLYNAGDDIIRRDETGIGSIVRRVAAASKSNFESKTDRSRRNSITRIARTIRECIQDSNNPVFAVVISRRSYGCPQCSLRVLAATGHRWTWRDYSPGDLR